MEKPSNNPSDDPIERFQEWYLEAQNSEMVDADAMALATCSEDAIPSCRILYFRRLMGSSFCFFTNYLSHKGEDLGLNPWASGLFLWHMLGRQVRVEGPVKKLSPEDSDAYFNQRAFESQLSAATSRQSRELESYSKFLSEIEENRMKFGTKISRPAHWGGYAIEAKKIEFWQQGEHRRHKRELYTQSANVWQKTLLYP